MKRSTALLLASLVLATGCASSDGDRASSAASPPASAPASAAADDWAYTPMNVGDLLARGGRQLTAPEVRALFTGAVMQGVSDNAAWRDMSFADGKVTGQSTSRGGPTIDYQGSWWVDEQGRRCWVNDRLVGAAPTCMFYYTLAGGYYASASDSSRRNARLTVRRIGKAGRPPGKT
jgi:hypothetical protein